MNVRLFDIQRVSTVDGPGIRTTVFFKGCNLKCLWCHNPESQSGGKQLLYYQDKCTHCGLCRSVCPNDLAACSHCGQCEKVCPNDARSICGKDYTIAEVMDIVMKDEKFYRYSGGGVTFSGGECMLQLEGLLALLKECKGSGIQTAIDTAGNVPFSSFERIREYTDIFLYDIKCMDPQRHERFTGVDNLRILSNLTKLLQTGVRLHIRIPIIPTVNESLAEMLKVKGFFDENGWPESIELLPYHRMGERKAMALCSPAPSFEIPSRAKLEELQAVFGEKCVIR